MVSVMGGVSQWLRGPLTSESSVRAGESSVISILWYHGITSSNFMYILGNGVHGHGSFRCLGRQGVMEETSTSRHTLSPILLTASSSPRLLLQGGCTASSTCPQTSVRLWSSQHLESHSAPMGDTELTDSEPGPIQLIQEHVLLLRRIHRRVPIEHIIDAQQRTEGRLKGVRQQQELQPSRGPPLAAQPPGRVEDHGELEAELDREHQAHPVGLRLGLDERVVVRRDVEVLELLEEVERAAGELVEPFWIELDGVDDCGCWLVVKFAQGGGRG